MLEPPWDVLKHVVDVHCHPTDSQIPLSVIDSLPITICAMATRQHDQDLVAELARAHPDNVIPCFGFHPWFAHWISVVPGPPPSKEKHYRSLFFCEDKSASQNSEQAQALEEMLRCLPVPLSIEDCISCLRQNFDSFPGAMLGEVGLDRSARVPLDHLSECRKLSPFSVPFEHQLAVLEAQLAVAVEMGRNISMHSVKSQKATIDLLERMKTKYGESWKRISIDMHSCGFSPETWRNIEKSHANVFLSLSTTINGRSQNHRKLIAMVSPDRLLVESDIHEVEQCAQRTWDMALIVADVKGWKVEERWEDEIDEGQWGVVRRLEHNFKVFMQGGHESHMDGRKRR